MPGARVAFITLNPGGSSIDPSHGVESCEAGSAYIHESWHRGAPGASVLQLQVQSMFTWLDLDPNQTLTAYFIPFRSPSLAALVARRKSVDFALGLWGGIFEAVQPSLVVCIGNDVEKGLRKLLGNPVSESRHLVGWGTQTALVTRYSRQVVLRLPHLSRFGLFGRAGSVEPLRIVRAEVERQRALVGGRRR